MSVLVVDDEPWLRNVISEALAEEGYDVSTAENGAQALSWLRRRRPDVIVLDMMMPVLDGWTFIEGYREIAGADIPIVGTSAAMTPESARRLQALGVSMCLPKPFDLAELLDCVSRLAGRSLVAV